MLGIHELWLFIISGLLLNVTPGPDTAYIIGRSVQLGWRGGAVAALGIGAGCLIHVSAAAIGLSALLAASSAAFSLVKWAGAAYLCFIGVKDVVVAPARARRGARKRRDFAAPGVPAGRADQCAEPEGGAVLPGLPAAIRGGGFAAQGRRLRAARPDFRLQRHAVVPWRRGVRRKCGRPYQAIRSSLGAGSIARWAGCSSISASASPCFRRAEVVAGADFPSRSQNTSGGDSALDR